METYGLAKCVENEQYGTFSARGTEHPAVMKTKDLTLETDIIRTLPCPTCGAAIEEACELHSGALRTGPHRDRKLSAVEIVENQHP
jgi:hypothetical protein